MKQLEAEKKLLERPAEVKVGGVTITQEKNMEVCECCASFLVVNDAEQRIQAHLDGKQHSGYAAIRKALEVTTAPTLATHNTQDTINAAFVPQTLAVVSNFYQSTHTKAHTFPITVCHRR